MHLANDPWALIDRPGLRKRVPYSDTQLWRLEKKGLFPQRVKIGPNRIAWVESEVIEWLRRRMAERER